MSPFRNQKYASEFKSRILFKREKKVYLTSKLTSSLKTLRVARKTKLAMSRPRIRMVRLTLLLNQKQIQKCSILTKTIKMLVLKLRQNKKNKITSQLKLKMLTAARMAVNKHQSMKRISYSLRYLSMREFLKVMSQLPI